MSLEEIVAETIAARRAEMRGRPIVVGICGAQGSGKTTLAAALCHRLDRAVTLSLDDLYRTRADRETLARDVHPLLRTRGVPGTHDVALGLGVFDAVRSGKAVALPRFDKARDDREPRAEWPVAPAGTQVVLFEGWCVGATSQKASAIVHPINALEADEDRQGKWRSFVNDALAGPYQGLFEQIDILVLLAAPSWDVVATWRMQQEHALRQSGATGPGVMDDSQVVRFISHYERLTRHIIEEMPGRADLVIRLDEERRPVQLESKGDEQPRQTACGDGRIDHAIPES